MEWKLNAVSTYFSTYVGPPSDFTPRPIIAIEAGSFIFN